MTCGCHLSARLTLRPFESVHRRRNTVITSAYGLHGVPLGFEGRSFRGALDNGSCPDGDHGNA